MNRAHCWISALPIAAFLGYTVVLGPLVAPPAEFSEAMASETSCLQSFHPIAVKVEAIDPIEPGAVVRLRVNAESALPVEAARVRVLDDGSAEILGSRTVEIGGLGPDFDVAAQTDFTVRVPLEGRALVQFRVEAEGSFGTLGRGAAFNLLPQGPQRPSRTVTDTEGRSVAEYPARRLSR